MEPLSRRQVLAGSLSILVAGCGSSSESAFQPASAQTPGVSPLAREASFLFVQSATSGSLASNGTEFTLRLTGAGSTLYFSDRPQRIYGVKSTQEFVAVDFPGFQGDPANAVLKLEGSDLATVLELLAATATAAGVEYRCRALPSAGGNFAGELVPPTAFPASFGAASLFIDDSANDPSGNTFGLTPTSGYDVQTSAWTVTGPAGVYTGDVVFSNPLPQPVDVLGGSFALTLSVGSIPPGTSTQKVTVVTADPEFPGPAAVPVQVRQGGTTLATGHVFVNLVRR